MDNLNDIIKQVEAFLLEIKPIIPPVSVQIPAMGKGFRLGIAKCKSGLRLSLLHDAERESAIPLMEVKFPAKISCCDKVLLDELHAALVENSLRTIAYINEAANSALAFLEEKQTKPASQKE